MIRYLPDPDEEDDIPSTDDVHTAELRDKRMREQYPGYSEESYGFSNFLGIDFPYVPGDPGL